MAIVLTTHSIRLYPTPAQASRLEHYLFVGRVAFNRALAAHKNWYETSGKGLSYYDHCKDLTVLRAADSFWADVPLEVTRDAVRRCHLASQAFFRRVKSKIGKPGFPRFKGRNRWNSFTIGNVTSPVVDGSVRVSGVDGLIRARNVREIVGKVKQQRIVRRAGKWFCQLVIDDGREAPPTVPVNSAVGIDVGLTSFATLSTGEKIDNPRFGRAMERKLRKAHRNISRKTKGSRNRRKAIEKLQRVYLTLQNHRSNFTHHESKRIVASYELIAVEDLKVANMARGRFAKSILDACWAQFTWQLSYKAANAGKAFAKVNARGTSQDCSNCGDKVLKDLSVRTHHCPSCGLTMDRDENAAMNVLQRAMNQTAPGGGRPIGYACGEDVGLDLAHAGSSSLVEAGRFVSK